MSWGGILAGALCALALVDVLLGLGAVLGLTNLDPGRNVWETLGTMLDRGAWVAVAVGAACFAGALVGTRLSDVGTRGVAALQGLVTWAVAYNLAGVFLLLYVTGAPPVATGAATELTSAASWWFFATLVLGAAGGMAGGWAAWPEEARAAHFPRPRTVAP